MRELEYLGVTIDSAHSKDLDDAVWVERADGVWNVTVSIALVAEHVADGGEIDRAALETGFTRYSAQDVRTSMLPLELAETLSLLPSSDKRVMGIVIRLDDRLEVISCEPGFGRLVNRGRLTHDDVAHILDDHAHELRPVVTRAWELCSLLLEKRRQQGALAFFSEESGMMTDEDGRLVDVGRHSGVSRAYIIVQELMILANSALAAYFAERGVQLLFRNHRGNPVVDRATLVGDLALASAGGTHSESALKRLGMVMERATLAPRVEGHYALNLPVYAWFTSPIRRYADLVNQRIALAFLASRPVPYSHGDLEAISDRLNDEYRMLKEEQAAAFKVAAERRAARTRSAADFSRLDATGMTAVIKSRFESGNFEDALVEEIAGRLSANGLTDKDIGRLLLSSSAAARQTACAHLRQNVSRAVSVINYFETDRICAPVTWGDDMDGSLFTARVMLTIGDKAHVGVDKAIGKKIARQTAAARALCMVADVEWPDNGRAASETSHPVMTGAEVNAKGDLISFCQRMKFGAPVFDVVSVGASHSPTFTATVAVKVNGSELRSDPVSASSRRDAERAASASMLEMLSRAEGTRSAGPAAEPNSKSALQEICQKRGWPLPVYECRQSGPPHAPAFSASVKVSTPQGIVMSQNVPGTSRKDAEKNAARAVLDKVA